LKAAMSNYLESVRLYPLSRSTFAGEIPGPYDIFCTAGELETIVQELGIDASLFVIGRTKPDVQARVERIACRRVLRLDGANFSSHTRPSDIKKMIQETCSAGVRPIVFHNFPKRVRKALKEFGIDENLYDVAGASSIPLRSY
jgi:hypothetical protein